MNFAITWHAIAFGEMNFLVGNHPEHKTELANALRVMTEELRADADTVGESRGDGVRIAFFDPLVVDFHVAAVDRHVQILSVRLRTLLF